MNIKTFIIWFLLAALLADHAYAGSCGDHLAVSLASDDVIDPGRSMEVRCDIAKKANPGAIGKGIPLANLAAGKEPAPAFLTEADHERIITRLREAVGMALELGVARQAEISIKYQPRYESTLNNLIGLHNSLEEKIRLFNADVAGSEDYLIGYSLNGRISLAVELIDILYEVSPKRLAQYVFHECLPVRGIVAEPADPSALYIDIESTVFGSREVSGLRDDLRRFIDDKASYGIVEWLTMRVETRRGVVYSSSLKDELAQEFKDHSVYKKAADSYFTKVDESRPELYLKTLVYQEAILLSSAIPSLLPEAGNVPVDAGIDLSILGRMRAARTESCKDAAALMEKAKKFWSDELPRFRLPVTEVNAHLYKPNPKLSINIVAQAKRFSSLLHRIHELGSYTGLDGIELVIVLADPENFTVEMTDKLRTTLAAQYYHSKIVPSAKNTIPINRDLGVSVSGGQYIVMWDDDVRLVGPVLERMVQALDETPDLGVVSVPSYNESLGIHRPGSYQLKHKAGNTLVLTSRVSGMIMATRGVLAKAGPFPVCWPNFGEDEYLPVQAHRMGYLNAFVCTPDAYAVHDHVQERLTTKTDTIKNVLLNETMLYYFEPRYAADAFRQGLTIARLRQYGKKFGTVRDIQSFIDDFRLAACKFIDGDDGALDGVRETARNNLWAAANLDHILMAAGFIRDNRDAVRAARELYAETGYAAVNPFLGPFTYTISDERPQSAEPETTAMPRSVSQDGMMITAEVRQVLENAVERLNRVMKAIDQDARVETIKVMPSSSTRGLMVRNSDFDNLVVYIRGIAQDHIEELNSLFMKWLKMPGLRLIDDYENIPLLIPVEDLKNQETMYGIDDMPMVVIYESGAFRPRDLVAEETNRMASMLFEKNVTRTKIFLLRGDIDEAWVRSLLKHEDPETYYYQELSRLLDDRGSFSLSPCAVRLIAALDDLFLEDTWRFIIPPGEEDGFEKALVELYEKGIVRFYGGKLRILWRMIGARWSDAVWNRWRFDIMKIGPSGDLIDVIGPLEERLTGKRPHIPAQELPRAMLSANPYLAERAMRQAMKEADGGREHIGAYIHNLGRKDILVNSAAIEAINAAPDRYELEIESAIVQALANEDIRSYFSPVRKQAIMMINLLFNSALERPEKADDIVSFMFRAVLDPAHKPGCIIPDRIGQDVMRNLGAVYWNISSPELREKTYRYFKESSESRIVRRKRLASDILKKIDTAGRGHVIEYEGPNGSSVLEASASEEVSYKNYFTRGVFDPENDILASIVKGRGVTVILDEAIYDLHYAGIKDYFDAHGIQGYTIYRGRTSEYHKNMASVFEIIDKAISDKRDRKAVFVAVGGGTLTDVVGLAAQLYRRKIDYVRIPTTLLGIIDAAIGVKVGVNYEGHKNFLGSFYPPHAVISDTSFLRTQDQRQLSSGMAEMLKMAIVSDPGLFADIERHGAEIIQNKDFIGKEDMIKRAAIGELRHIQRDFYERDMRREVDFGHTFAHFLEEISGYELLHGEAVGLDILITGHIAMKRGLLTPGSYERILNACRMLRLPLFHPSMTAGKLMAGVEKARAHKGGNLIMVIPRDIGKVAFSDTVSPEEIEAALSFLGSLNRPEDRFRRLMETDIPVRAHLFKTNLIRLLTEQSEKIFFIGVENGMAGTYGSNIMPVYKALYEISEMRDAAGNKLFPNLVFKKGSAEVLTAHARGLNEQGSLDLNNAFICARRESVDNGRYGAVMGSGKAWISVIDDSRGGDYIPVFESILINIMACLGADNAAIKDLYESVSEPSALPLEDMLLSRTIYILPKACAFDQSQLRDVYERVREVYLSA